MNPHIILSIMDGYNEREMAELKKENMLAHLQGQYFAAAISATVGNMFKKRGHAQNTYPDKPFMFAFEKENEQGNKESKEEIAVYEMKQRTKLLEKQGLPQSPM